MEALRALFAAGIYALAGLRQLRVAYDAWAPASESESASDRAGRLGELRVAELFQGVSGALVFQSLRIPDTGGRGRREIDLVILTRKKLYVIEVKNWSGVIKIQPDGNWCQLRKNGSRQTLPDVVQDTKYRAELLEAYIARRGIKLPPEFVEYKVFLVNPECRPEDDILYQPEVLTSDQWQFFLDKEVEQQNSGWLKNLLPGLKKDSIADNIYQQLSFILHSSPTWDKLQLEGGRIVVGDFMYFKGRPEDMQILRSVKRSNISYMEMCHGRNLFQNVLALLVGISPKVRITCNSRDVRGFLKRKHRQQVALEATVRPDVEVVFRVVGSSRAESFKVNNVVSLALSV